MTADRVVIAATVTGVADVIVTVVPAAKAEIVVPVVKAAIAGPVAKAAEMVARDVSVKAASARVGTTVLHPSSRRRS